MCCVLCLLLHFQKKGFISFTFDPPLMYSTDLSYTVTTAEEVIGLPKKSVILIFTLAFWPGLYFFSDGSDFHIKYPPFQEEQ